MRAYVLYNYLNEPSDRITFRISVTLPKIKIILIFRFRRFSALHQLLFCEFCAATVARYAECWDLFIRVLLSHFHFIVFACAAPTAFELRTANKKVCLILYESLWFSASFFVSDDGWALGNSIHCPHFRDWWSNRQIPGPRRGLAFSPFILFIILFSTVKYISFNVVYKCTIKLFFLRHSGLECVGITSGPRRTANLLVFCLFCN